MSGVDLEDMMTDARSNDSALLYTPGTRHGFELVPMPQGGTLMTYPCDEETSDD